MTREQWIRNNRGINENEDLDPDFLSALYDRIVSDEIKMETEGQVFANAEKKGWLTKQGGRIKTWKKRWFILSDFVLFYCKSPADTEPCGIIPLENLEVKEYREKKKKWGFVLTNPQNEEIRAAKKTNGAMVRAHHSNYIVMAQSKLVMEEWISAINKNIHRNPFYDLIAQKRALLEKKKKEKPNKSVDKDSNYSDNKSAHTNSDTKNAPTNSDTKNVHTNSDTKNVHTNSETKYAHANSETKNVHTNSNGIGVTNTSDISSGVKRRMSLSMSEPIHQEDESPSDQLKIKNAEAKRKKNKLKKAALKAEDDSKPSKEKDDKSEGSISPRPEQEKKSKEASDSASSQEQLDKEILTDKVKPKDKKKESSKIKIRESAIIQKNRFY